MVVGLVMTCKTVATAPHTACRWNDTLDERNSWGMSAGLQSDRPDNGAQVSGNYQHLSSAGEWDISGTYAANDYSFVSSSWSGSFTATQYGAAFIAAAPPMNLA